MKRICKTTRHENYQLQELWTHSASCLPWLCVIRPLTPPTINKVHLQHFSFLALSFIMSERKKHKRAKARAAQRVLQWFITVSALPLSAFHLFFPQLCFSYIYLPLGGQLKGTHVAAELLFCLTVAPSSPHKGSLSGFTLLQSTYLDIFPSKYAPNG